MPWRSCEWSSGDIPFWKIFDRRPPQSVDVSFQRDGHFSMRKETRLRWNSGPSYSCLAGSYWIYRAGARSIPAIKFSVPCQAFFRWWDVTTHPGYFAPWRKGRRRNHQNLKPQNCRFRGFERISVWLVSAIKGISELYPRVSIVQLPFLDASS